MSAGDAARDRLLRVVAGLHRELGYLEAPSKAGRAAARGETLAGEGPLDERDERLIAAIRESLAQLADAASRAPGALPTSHRTAVLGALDGAEVVMRYEVLAGNAGQLAALLPGFVFLVTLPIVGQDEALGLSERTVALLG